MVELTETGDLRDKLAQMELLIVGDRTLLELSGIEDRTLLKEAETHLFLKMFLRYLKKGTGKVFSACTKRGENGEASGLSGTRYYSGLRISGAEIVEDKPQVGDMIVNKINGAETECILSVLPSPQQENFIGENKAVLDARVWLGLGDGLSKSDAKKSTRGKIQNFFVKFMLKSEIKRKKRNSTVQPMQNRISSLCTVESRTNPSPWKRKCIKKCDFLFLFL
ncbi:MAG: WecB/TagA/CpsF family glycosyltransferase [Sellimonas intestinalis]